MAKIFILTESRTVAKTIAQSLGVNIQRKGYYSKGDISVSWTGEIGRASCRERV